jgi:transposase
MYVEQCRRTELRAIAIGRRNWTFAGSDEGGRRAATIYSLIATAKLNDVDPQRCAGALAGSSCQAHHELLPWNWRQQHSAAAAA